MLWAGLTLDLDITYVLVLALLLAPLAILNGLVLGPFMKLVEERHERLSGALERARHRLEESEQRAKTFEQKMAAAAQRGQEIRSELRAEAQREMNLRLEAEKQRTGVELEAALVGVRAARQKGLQQIEQEARRLAELTAAKLLGRGV